MRLLISLSFIFVAMVKNADASTSISFESREAVYNIIVKSDLTISDRSKYFTTEDIILEYETLCNNELKKTNLPQIQKDIRMICEMSLETINNLGSPQIIAEYESYIKQKIISRTQGSPLHIENLFCDSPSSKLCETKNTAITIADLTLRIMFYPFKVLMTGDLKI